MIFVNLLNEMEQECPDSVIDCKGLKVVIDAGKYEILASLEFEEGDVVNMSLEGIYAVAPSISKMFLSIARSKFAEYNAPTVFTRVSRHVFDSLDAEAYRIGSPAWAVADKMPELVGGGKVSRRSREVLNVLAANGSTSPREMALFLFDSEARASVTTASCYLQVLYKNGLVVRKKINGSERGIRGYTYYYQIVPDVLG